MKATIYSIAVPILAAVGFAQDTPPTQPKQTPATEQPAQKADKTSDKSKEQSADRLQEMKTQTYYGTLVDASCAGAGSGSTATTSTSSGSAPASSPDSKASQSGNPSTACTLSSSASQFALQMRDGQTVRFDDVGNTRAQEALKAHKKWTDTAAASKPVRVKVSGILNGDKLTVMSIN